MWYGNRDCICFVDLRDANVRGARPRIPSRTCRFSPRHQPLSARAQTFQACEHSRMQLPALAVLFGLLAVVGSGAFQLPHADGECNIALLTLTPLHLHPPTHRGFPSNGLAPQSFLVRICCLRHLPEAFMDPFNDSDGSTGHVSHFVVRAILLPAYLGLSGVCARRRGAFDGTQLQRTGLLCGMW